MDENAGLTIAHAEGVTTLTIDRPKALNALDPNLVEALGRALDAVPAETRAVVLTGAGEKAFVAGADIKAMAAFSAEDARAFSEKLHGVGRRLERLDVPVIAAVNGFCLGGGCELMLACDFAIAADNARFGQPEVGLGVIPGFGGTTRLGRRIGDARARQMIFTGETIDAAEALRVGLVTELHPLADLMDRARALAAKIAKNAPLAVAHAKRSARVGEETDLSTANAFETSAFALCFATEDQAEGMKAFMEKRPAAWKGR
jgi:enoyl-CoA hydratase